jgi:ribosomal protein L20A (L18A)
MIVTNVPKIRKTSFPKVFLVFGKWTFLKMSKIDFWKKLLDKNKKKAVGLDGLSY